MRRQAPHTSRGGVYDYDKRYDPNYDDDDDEDEEQTVLVTYVKFGRHLKGGNPIKKTVKS